MLQIILRAPEAKNQKHSQPIFSSVKIIRRIHRPKDIIPGHLLVKCVNKPTNPVGTDGIVDFVFRQRIIIRSLIDHEVFRETRFVVSIAMRLHFRAI